MANYNRSSADDLGQFTCAVCMEIFQSPTRISCGHGHIFCRSCVANVQPVNYQLMCPQCRGPFLHGESVPAHDVETLMQSSIATCRICRAQMKITDLRQHMETCGESNSAAYKFKPILQTSQPVPQVGPNRMTFHCPYCNQANLDCKAMIEHCNSLHRHDHSHVVCPICASMPWGNSNQQSINFLRHLNTRHTFEYQTYVDYEKDDDEMLRAAMEASLQQR